MHVVIAQAVLNAASKKEKVKKYERELAEATARRDQLQARRF